MQAIAQDSGLHVEQTRRLHRAGIPWVLFGPTWKGQHEAVREDMNPVGYLAALAPFLEMSPDASQRHLMALRERQDPDAYGIAEVDMT